MSVRRIWRDSAWSGGLLAEIPVSAVLTTGWVSSAANLRLSGSASCSGLRASAVGRAAAGSGGFSRKRFSSRWRGTHDWASSSYRAMAAHDVGIGCGSSTNRMQMLLRIASARVRLPIAATILAAIIAYMVLTRFLQPRNPAVSRTEPSQPLVRFWAVRPFRQRWYLARNSDLVGAVSLEVIYWPVGFGLVLLSPSIMQFS